MTDKFKMAFRGVGKIERRTGFAPNMTVSLKEMCRVLYRAGREDILLDLKHGRVTFRDVWSIYRKGQWERIPTAQHLWPFAERFSAWAQTKPRPGYRKYAKWVQTAVAMPGLTLGGLRERLLQYRAACDGERKGAMFNRSLSYLQAFLRDTVTTDHALYHGVSAIQRLPEYKKRPKNPQRPEQARAIREALGGELGRMWWTLCCSGMLPDEYFAGKWALEDGRLHIKGTKRDARDRFVPILCDVAPPTISQGLFQTRLRKSGLGVRPKDGRDTFSLWCKMAGLPLAWEKALMGHTAQDITVMYGWEESDRIVEEAGEKLGTLLGTGKRGGKGKGPSGNDLGGGGVLTRAQARPRTPEDCKANKTEDSRTKPPERKANRGQKWGHLAE